MIARLLPLLILAVTGCAVQTPGGWIDVGRNAETVFTSTTAPDGTRSISLVMGQDQSTGLADAVTGAVTAYAGYIRKGIQEAEEITKRTVNQSDNAAATARAISDNETALGIRQSDNATREALAP